MIHLGTCRLVSKKKKNKEHCSIFFETGCCTFSRDLFGYTGKELRGGGVQDGFRRNGLICTEGSSMWYGKTPEKNPPPFMRLPWDSNPLLLECKANTVHA
jgi:hypothetical protein